MASKKADEPAPSAAHTSNAATTTTRSETPTKAAPLKIREIDGLSDGHTIPEPIAMTPTKSSSSERTTPLRRRPWKDAFAHSCLSRGSLTVSVKEICADSDVLKQEIPQSEQVLYWNDRAATLKALATLFQEQSAETGARRNAAAAAPSSFLSTVVGTAFDLGVKAPVKLAYRTYQYVTRDEFDDDYDVSLEEPDEKEVVGILPGEDEPLLNPDLALECLLFLRQTMLNHASETLVVPLRGGASTAATELLNWTRGILKTEVKASRNSRMGSLVAQLEHSQMQLLSEILTDSGLVEVVLRRPAADDLLVLIPPTDSNQREHRLVMYDLQLAIAKQETRLTELMAKADDCTKRARAAHKAGNKKAAVKYLRDSKQLGKQIEQLEGTLFNLTNQLHALDGALNTKKVFEVTKQTTAVLKNLRPDLEETDDVMLDFEEALEADRVTNDTLSNIVSVTDCGATDDELLAELAGLTLEDSPEKPAPPTKDAEFDALAELDALGGISFAEPPSAKKRVVAS
jgi:hypothetical protein